MEVIFIAHNLMKTGRLYDGLHMANTALDHLRDSCRHNPSSLAIRYRLATGLMSVGHLRNQAWYNYGGDIEAATAALSCFQEACTVLPGNAPLETVSDLYMGLSSAYYGLGDYMAAAEMASHVIEIDLQLHGLRHPTTIDHYGWRGLCYSWVEGMTPMAFEDISTAIMLQRERVAGVAMGCKSDQYLLAKLLLTMSRALFVGGHSDEAQRACAESDYLQSLLFSGDNDGSNPAATMTTATPFSSPSTSSRVVAPREQHPQPQQDFKQSHRLPTAHDNEGTSSGSVPIIALGAASSHPVVIDTTSGSDNKARRVKRCKSGASNSRKNWAVKQTVIPNGIITPRNESGAPSLPASSTISSAPVVSAPTPELMRAIMEDLLKEVESRALKTIALRDIVTALAHNGGNNAQASSSHRHQSASAHLRGSLLSNIPDAAKTAHTIFTTATPPASPSSSTRVSDSRQPQPQPLPMAQKAATTGSSSNMGRTRRNKRAGKHAKKTGVAKQQPVSPISTTVPRMESDTPSSPVSSTTAVAAPPPPSSELMRIIMEKLVTGVEDKALKPITALDRTMVTAAANNGSDEAVLITSRPPSPSYLQILLSGDKGNKAAGGTKVDVADSSSVVIKEDMVASSSPPTAAGDTINSNNVKPPAKKTKKGRRLMKKAVLYYTSSL